MSTAAHATKRSRSIRHDDIKRCDEGSRDGEVEDLDRDGELHKLGEIAAQWRATKRLGGRGYSINVRVKVNGDGYRNRGSG